MNWYSIAVSIYRRSQLQYTLLRAYSPQQQPTFIAGCSSHVQFDLTIHFRGGISYHVQYIIHCENYFPKSITVDEVIELTNKPLG